MACKKDCPVVNCSHPTQDSCCYECHDCNFQGELQTKNKAVYTTTFVAGGWAGAVISWAGVVISWAGAVIIWAGAVLIWVGACTNTNFPALKIKMEV